TGRARIPVREKRITDANANRAAAKALVAATKSLSDQGPALAYLDGYLALYSGEPKAALTALAGAGEPDPFWVGLQARASELAGDKAGAATFWRKVLTFNGHSLQNAFARPAARKAMAAQD